MIPLAAAAAASLLHLRRWQDYGGKPVWRQILRHYLHHRDPDMPQQAAAALADGSTPAGATTGGGDKTEAVLAAETAIESVEWRGWCESVCSALSSTLKGFCI